jgi:hypothetical protein
MEGRPADYGIVETVLKNLGHNTTLCKDIQRIHDEWKPEEWEGEFKRLAHKWGIKVPPPA